MGYKSRRNNYKKFNKTKRKKKFTYKGGGLHKKNKAIRKKRKNTQRKKRKNTRRVKYIKENCSPKNKEEELPYTCYTSKGLHKIKKIWNKKHPDKQEFLSGQICCVLWRLASR